TILLRAAHAGQRWFDRMVLLAPMIALPGMRRLATTRIMVKVMRSVGLGALYVPGGSASTLMQLPFSANLLTPHPSPYTPTSALLTRGVMRRTVARCGQPRGGVGGCRVSGDGRAARRALPRQHPAADSDPRRGHGRDHIDARDRRIRATAACRLAPRRAGRAPRAIDGAGSFSHPGLGRVRRLRAGHAVVQVSGAQRLG